MVAATLFLTHSSNAFVFPVIIFNNPQSVLYPRATKVKLSRKGDISSRDEGGSVEDEYKDGNNRFSFSSEPISHSSPVVKAPTAPWMKGPLLVDSNQILDLSGSRTKKDSNFRENGQRPDKELFSKVGGGRGKKIMKRIFRRIEKLQGPDNAKEAPIRNEGIKFKFSPGDLWGDGNCEYSVEVQENLEKSLNGIEFDVPLEGVKEEGKLRRMPWVRDKKIVIGRVKKDKVVNATNLDLDELLLERLRAEAARMKVWVKVKKAGVTQAVVDQVHYMWRSNELVLLKFDVPLIQNMARAREIVEMKTGGVVVWCKKDTLAVYKRSNSLCLETSSDIHRDSVSAQEDSSPKPPGMNRTLISVVKPNKTSLDKIIVDSDGKWEDLELDASLYEREADRLLDGLGPRFVDWWMSKPLPVDADLLPELVPGYRPPFRLCLPRMRSKLIDAELTYLRKLAHPLPTHFVLGRNRNLQGLASAILKLWEKCHIAKIAVKWGIPNTDNEQMANELKSLTGGVLLLRNKFIIILYRGKDFVPPHIKKLVAEREMELRRCEQLEEAVRLKASEIFLVGDEQLRGSSASGTLSEFQNIQSEHKNQNNGSEVEVHMGAERARLEKELKNQERKLFILKKKVEKSAKLLATVNNAWRPSEPDADREIISQEERECLRKIGLKMESSLVLGRRGVYDGVIESMHQHWKHREMVKVISMQKSFSQVIYTANFLEVESGGILVSIDKMKEGHAILIYRGKNYKRPKLAARNLLNKRAALSRSLELQRIGSLKFFARQREQAIFDLQRKLATFTKRRPDTVGT